MQQPYIVNGQFNGYQQPQQYNIPPNSTIGQLQPNQQTNAIQMQNQTSDQQPLIITQSEGKKKKKSISILNVIITILAIALVAGVVYLGVKQCIKKKEELDAQKSTENASEQNAELQKPELTRRQPELIIDKSGGELDGYTAQSVNNNAPTNNLETINQSQNQSPSAGS